MRGTLCRAASLLVFLAFSRASAQVPTPAMPPRAPAPADGDGMLAGGDGHPAIGGVLVAGDDEPGTIRASWRASYFDAPDFGDTGTDLTGLTSSLAVGWSPVRSLSVALQASGTSHHADRMVPSSVQALGDVGLSAAWSPYRTRALSAGARAGVLLLAGDEPFAYGEALSPFVDGIASGREGALRWAANAGFVLDRSEELLPEDSALTPPLRAAYGVADGPYARVGLMGGARLGRLEPFAGLKSRIWFGGVKKGDSHLGTLGLRAVLGSRDRLVGIEAGVDLAFVTGDETAKRPLEPPARVFAGLSIALPPVRPVPVVTHVEVPAPPPAPTTGDVEGLVRDGRSGEPLAWVVVEIPGVTQNPILSDASGVYRVKGIPAGAVKVRVQKQGYAITSVPVEVKAGATTTADVTLESVGSRTTGVFTGDVRGRDGKPVAAKITFQFGNETRTIAADASGKFQVSLPSGSFSLKVEAPGFVPQTKTLSVSAGEQTVFNFVLAPVQP